MARPAHTPVLLTEVLEALNPRPGQTAADLTAGRGGHAVAIAERLGSGGALALFDLDPDNLAAAAARVGALDAPPALHTFHASFADAPRLLAKAGLKADLALADLGFSSNQMDDPARGFSFQGDGPLDMRLNPGAPITAAELVNSLSERELTELIRDFGEDPAAPRIARKLVHERKAEPITTTARFAAIVRSAIPQQSVRPSIDPATRTFQAFRIAVNDELGSLRVLLESIERAASRVGRGGASAASWLSAEARVAIISFHSLEDRPVKRSFGALAERALATELARKPVTASEEEVATNPRSRSAKLRAIRLGPSMTRP